ncbi:MAG: S-layer homology domain-containing protein [Firmicutes bacterium]|nr:S-layer homology domain-containing protein [Bacillota bacterium]
MRRIYMRKFFIAMLLVLALTTTAFAASFADVPSSHWAYQAVNKLVASGILSGYPDGTFKGQNNLSRYEIAVVVARVLEEIEAEQAALADKVEDAANNLSIGEAQQVNQIVKSLVAKNTGEELSNEQADEVRSIVQALTYEFRPELTDLGVAVDELDSRLTAVEADVEGLKASKPKITFGAWGRGIVSIAGNDDGDAVSRQGVSWDAEGEWGGSRIGYTLKGESADGDIGIHIDSNADGGGFGHQDQQKIWVKPSDNFTFEIGPSVFFDKLRGNAAYGAWNWMRFETQDDEDAIFVRGKAGKGDGKTPYRSTGAQDGIIGGALVHYDKDKLSVFASFDQSEGSSEVAGEKEEYTAAKMFKRGQYGVGYETDFGLVRGQYIGKAYLDDPTADELEEYGVFNAAVRFDKLASDLTLDVGLFVPTEDPEDCGEYTGLNAYANYTGIDKWTLHGTVQTKFDKGDAKGDEDLAFQLGFGGDYDLADGAYTINTDLRYFNENWMADDDPTTNDDNDQIGFLVGIAKNLSNGKVGIGLEYTTNGFASSGDEFSDPEEDNWAIPIVLEYWF